MASTFLQSPFLWKSMHLKKLLSLVGSRVCQSASSHLEVTPKDGQYDVETRIKVRGLEPRQKVTLKAHIDENGGKILHSNAHFIANEEGVIDLAKAPSVGGSFKGVFPAGLFSVASVVPSIKPLPKNNKIYIEESIKIKVSLQNGHRAIEENDFVIDGINLERRFMGPGVTRVPVKVGRVRGVLYLPPGKGPFPGVIDMFGAAAILVEHRAALNASRGIASLALAYFNHDDIPYTKLFSLDLDYFEEAVQYLISHPNIISDKCGVIGNCYGVFLGFMLSSYVKEVKACFLVNGPLRSPMSSLYYRGEKIVYKMITKEDNEDYFRPQNLKLCPNKEYIYITSSLEQHMVDAVKQSKHCDFVVTSAGGDNFQFYKVWENLMNSLSPEDRKNFILKTYPDAGHFIHPPNTPFMSEVLVPIWNKNSTEHKSTLVHFGGEPLPTYNMQRDNWKWMYELITTKIQAN